MTPSESIEQACIIAIGEINNEIRKLIGDKTKLQQVRRLMREKNMYHSFIQRLNKHNQTNERLNKESKDDKSS